MERLVRLCALWILILIPSLQPGAVRAQEVREPNAVLVELREMVLYARYAEAIEAAGPFLDRQDLRASQRNLGLELLATAHIANRELEEAFRVLQALYTRDPQHRLSDADASPRVQSAFARARDERPPPATVELTHEPPTLVRRGPPLIELRVTQGADAVEEIRLSYQQGGDTGFATVVMSFGDDGFARARIPVQVGTSEGYRVSYYVQALAPSRVPLSSLGSPESPLVLAVPTLEAAEPVQVLTSQPPAAAPPPPATDGGGGILSEWWFWTLTAAVIGGGVTGYVLLGPPSEGPPDGTLGSIELQ